MTLDYRVRMSWVERAYGKRETEHAEEKLGHGRYNG